VGEVKTGGKGNGAKENSIVAVPRESPEEKKYGIPKWREKRKGLSG